MHWLTPKTLCARTEDARPEQVKVTLVQSSTQFGQFVYPAWQDSHREPV